MCCTIKLSALNLNKMKTEYAIQKAGSKSALARILGVTKGAISQYGLNLPEGRTWQLRVIKNMTLKLLAERAGLTYQHVTDYFNADDKPTRRDLPAKHVAIVEYVLGNTLISQWLAMKAGLTVVEEVQANIQAERKAA